MIKPGDTVYYHGHLATVNSIASRQNRGLCAYVHWADMSGSWIEVGRIIYLREGLHMIPDKESNS